jgi:hypothetical protein
MLGLVENRRCRNHYTEIKDLETVTLEHDADDVLANIVNVALHRRE